MCPKKPPMLPQDVAITRIYRTTSSPSPRPLGDACFGSLAPAPAPAMCAPSSAPRAMRPKPANQQWHQRLVRHRLVLPARRSRSRSSTPSWLRLFEDLGRPRVTIHVRCRHGPTRAGHAAPLHRVHPWGVGDPSWASQSPCSARVPEMLVGSDGTSQRLRTRISLQEARDHHVLAIGL